MEHKKRKAKHSHLSRGCRKKVMAVLLCLLLLDVIGIGVTMAFLVTQTDGIVNTFTPSKVTTEVTENFDGEIKSNVNVKNNGDTDAYVRVKLVTYRVNDKGEHIGGTATIPEFALGKNWFFKDGFYYYAKSVAAGKSPENPLIGSDGITLQTYTDADGGKQVIEVMAEAIQALGTNANGESPVELAWGVTKNDDGTIASN